MEREMMTMILQEQDFQQSEMCNNEGCLVKMGQLVGVDYMVGGTVARIGDLYSVSARMVDVGTGKILRTASTETRGSLEDVLKISTNDVARSLVGLKTRERTNIAGWSWLGGATSLGIAGGVFTYLSFQSYAMYNKPNQLPSKVKAYRNDTILREYTSYGLFGAAAVASGIATYKFLTFGTKVQVQTLASFSPSKPELQVAVGF
jgi:curli biogenesis system outer membrane secretion channel CsgG